MGRMQSGEPEGPQAPPEGGAGPPPPAPPGWP
ncbi:MAG: hypothetical protein JWL78_1472, partial [Chloroflexi bacterium]|nr:hypothetical protein [Chloroflexota bacterium]